MSKTTQYKLPELERNRIITRDGVNFIMRGTVSSRQALISMAQVNLITLHMPMFV